MAGNKKTDRKPKAPSPVKTSYLVLYNAVSALAWSVVLFRAVSIFAKDGYPFVVTGVGEWTKWTQTVAGLEVLHSLLGKPDRSKTPAGTCADRLSQVSFALRS